MRIVIVGSGIGGLAAAISLTAEGYQVTVVEREPEFTAAGAGIVLASNALRCLDRLGVSLRGEGQLLSDIEIRAKNGRLLSAGAPRAGGPSYGISRSRLRDLMARALPASVKTHFDSAITSIAGDGDRIGLHGPAGDLEADLVVAADGLRSRIRDQLPTRPGRLRYSGTTCWRGIVDLDAATTATEAWGGKTRIGVVPVGDGRAYYFLVVQGPAGAPSPGDLGGFTGLFAGFAGVAGELVDSLTGVPTLHHDLFELDRPVWGHGKVLLLGDAAHGMTPNQGQGAAMAIEDAVGLGVAIRSGVDGALDRYKSLRGRRVRRVQLDSRRLGGVAHWSEPAIVAARNAAMRAMPRGALDRKMSALFRPGVELARGS